MLLEGKVAVVTGASRGIGKEIAKTLAKNGASVVINYVRNQAEAEKVQAEIESEGGKAHLFQGDVSQEEDAKGLMDFTVKTLGKIDVLVNNAGITRDNLLISMSLEDWEAVINTNLRGPFLCSKYAVKQMMRKRHGKIINIGSVSGILGQTGQANYASAKAGLIGLTKVIAQEYGERGIIANCVAPGFIETDMSAGVADVVEEKKNIILQKRAGKPSEVAGLVLYLASDAGNYVNGEVIRVDGGIRF